jgi:hypothetical protein
MYYKDDTEADTRGLEPRVNSIAKDTVRVKNLEKQNRIHL